MSSLSFRFVSFALTAFVALFLWLPIASLFAPALWTAFKNPAQLSRVLPLDEIARGLFRNTVELGFLCCLWSLVFGFPLGIVCARAPKLWRNGATILCVLPLAIPPIVLATTWLDITRTPPARSMAAVAATQSATFSPIWLSSFVLAFSFFPIVALSIRATLTALPPEIEDASRGLGNGWQTWKRVLVPLLQPAIWGALGAVFLLSMWEMGAPDLLDARTYSVKIYRDLAEGDALSGNGKDVRAALDSLPMFALGALALWPALRALGSQRWRGAASSVLSPQAQRESLFALPPSLLVLLASPLASIVVLLTLLRPLRVFWEAMSDNNVEIINTLVLSTLAALLITALSFALVASWHNWSSSTRKWAFAVCVAPLLVAPIATGIALLHFWNQPQFSWVYGDADPTNVPILDWLQDQIERFALPLFGYLARFLPLGILLLQHAASQLDDDVLDAARGLGATQPRLLRTVWWPLLRPSLLGVFALMWALCASELSTSVLVQQPGGQPLTLPIFQLMHIFALDKVAALCLILIGLSALVWMLSAFLSTAPTILRRKQK
ncbi:MAG TPA: ABC transporter permease subunit [Abditibacteriaceae bacterium]|nr:ABC transporter permease subunit [Abditibacteriaceae bacterium]